MGFNLAFKVLINIFRLIKPRRMRVGGNQTKFLLEKPKGKSLLERPTRRWKEIIK
jgi:hypothetical protein